MKTSNKFARTFTIVSVMTLAFWGLSYGFASLAANEPYPQSMLTQVEKRLNAKQSELHENLAWSDAQIKRVEITVKAADVEFEAQGVGEFKADLQGHTGQGNTLTGHIENGVLTIYAVGNRQTNFKFGAGPNIEINNDFRLKLTLPESFHGEIKVTSGSGDIFVPAIQLETAELSTGSGDIRVEAATIAHLAANAGSGDIELKGHLKQTKVTTGSGDVSVQEIEGENLALATGSGDVSVKIGSLERWTAHLTTSSGDISSPVTHGQDDESARAIQVGSGPGQLKIETGSGDISVAL